MLLCLKKFTIKLKLFTVVASLKVFKMKLKSSLEQISHNGPKHIHTTPNNTHGDCTLLAHVNLMSLNIPKSEIIKERLILNYPPDEVMVKYSKNLSNFHQQSWKLIKKGTLSTGWA